MPGITAVPDVVDAPTIGTATGTSDGSLTASVTFTAATTGGAASSYGAISDPGSLTGTSSTSTITVSGLTTGTALIESRRYKKVVVVGVDKMSSIIDYSDRQTCIIFGDGAAAVLLEPNTIFTSRI